MFLVVGFRVMVVHWAKCPDVNDLLSILPPASTQAATKPQWIALATAAVLLLTSIFE